MLVLLVFDVQIFSFRMASESLSLRLGIELVAACIKRSFQMATWLMSVPIGFMEPTITQC